MSLESAVSFFIAVLIFGVTPGPGVFSILARALVSGARSCFWLALGMTISDMLYLIAACLGLAAIATHWTELFTAIRIIGAIYLFYLGWKIWSAPPELEPNGPKVLRCSTMLSFTQGFMISASNPKVILFYIAFLPTFMDLTLLNAADITLAAVLTVIALMIGLMAIALFAARARKFFSSQQGVRRLNRGAGTIMMAAGTYLMASK